MIPKSCMVKSRDALSFKEKLGVDDMNKAEKIRTILLPTIPGQQRGDRTHYLSEDHAAWWNPQRFFQRFPQVYSWIKAFLSPTFSWHSWKQVVPDPAKNLVIDLG